MPSGSGHLIIDPVPEPPATGRQEILSPDTPVVQILGRLLVLPAAVRYLEVQGHDLENYGGAHFGGVTAAYEINDALGTVYQISIRVDSEALYGPTTDPHWVCRAEVLLPIDPTGEITVLGPAHDPEYGPECDLVQEIPAPTPPPSSESLRSAKPTTTKFPRIPRALGGR